MKPVQWITTAAIVAALAGCGAEEIESPGNSGNVTINNPPPASPNPSPPPPPTASLVTPATGCPTIPDPAGLNDAGTISGPTGEYRVCELPSRFTASTTLEKFAGLLYSINGRVDVGLDRGAAPTADAAVVLTIRPGVVLYGATGTSWLAVNRGNRIQAVGNATSPIVFTSRDNVLGLSNDDSHGQWGGVVLLGRAPTTDCTVAPAATPGSVNCERQTEGSVDPAYFGGATANDNSGTVDYVQIRYSGYVLSGNSELQSLTLGGVGSGTTIGHFQSHNSSDDGFEIFGGSPTLRRIVVTGADDDNIDVDTGYQGTIQYVIAVQKTSGNPDSMVEAGFCQRAGRQHATHEHEAGELHVRTSQRGVGEHRSHAVPRKIRCDSRQRRDHQPDGLPATQRHEHPHGRRAQPEAWAAGVPVRRDAVWRRPVRRNRWRDSAAGDGRIQRGLEQQLRIHRLAHGHLHQRSQ